MNVTHDPDAILAAWIEEGPTRLPEATRRAIGVNARTMNQHRHPLWMPRRRPMMNPFVKMLATAIAIAVVIGGTWYALAPGGQIGGPPPAIASPSPSPTPAVTSSVAASAAPRPSATTMPANGEIFPGRYRTALEPSMTITIDREVRHNCAPGFKCRGSIDANTAAWLNIEFGMPRIEVHVFRVDKVYDPAREARVVDVPDDLATWLTIHPGMEVVAQKDVVVGGVPGRQLDIRVGPEDLEIAPITGVTDPRLGFGARSDPRVIVVPVDGHQILILLAGEGQPAASSNFELQPLVDSISWD
jgi:hypothetical protein